MDVKNIIQEEVIQFQLDAVAVVMEAEGIIVTAAEAHKAAAAVLAGTTVLADTAHKQAPVAEVVAAYMVVMVEQAVGEESEFMVKVAMEQEEPILLLLVVVLVTCTEVAAEAEVVGVLVVIPTYIHIRAGIIM